MVITVILAVALVGTLGYVFYQNFVVKKDNVSKTDDSSKNKSPGATSPAKVDPMAGWKTYTSSKLGFSFRYPSDWTISNPTPVYPPEVVAELTSPDIATEKYGSKSGVDAPSMDISIYTVEKSKAQVMTDVTPGTVSALLIDNSGGDTSQYFTKKYSETINSISVSEFDMLANPTYFAAVFPIGDSYIEINFLTTPTKADLTSTMSKILSSVKES